VKRPFIKVCGITRAEDARIAVELGADALGFVLVPESPRCVPVEIAATIARSLPDRVAKVGVVVNRIPGEVRDLVRDIGLTAIQAHGEESPGDCRAYQLPVIKAIPAGDHLDRDALVVYREFPLLLDAAFGSSRGGTGMLANWTTARSARDAGYRILLAGGLGPENVLDAVRAVEPVAVDLNSGVESGPGLKDPERIRLAIEALRGLEPLEETAWPW
jgi:phosphoribosylanthranilate isomerase